MLPMPFVNVITLQLRLQHGPPMLLVHARPTVVLIVVFSNALRSPLRLQFEPPMPLSHQFVNLLGSQLRLQHRTPPPYPLLGPWMLHPLHLQCP